MASLVAGSFIGAIILYKQAFVLNWIDAVYVVLANGTWGWLFLVIGLFGSLVALIELSGGALGFSAAATKICKGRKQSLFMTWILGIIVFVDDWLNALAVGAAMRNVTDKFKVPRELLAYIICATGAVVCSLIPFSTWGAFFAGQLEANGVAAVGQGTAVYIQTIPYISYAMVALIVPPLYIAGIIPHFGAMKKAEKRAETLGLMIPPINNEEGAIVEEKEAIEAGMKKGRAVNFLIPMVLLAVITIITAEILYGVLASLLCCAVMYFPQKLMNGKQFLDAMMSGFKSMMGVVGIITAAFILREMNSGLGLPAFVIGLVKDTLDPRLLPLFVFIIISALTFAAGNFWGMAAISFPVIIPIAFEMGVDPILISGAIISGTTFGSNACFYGSEVTLTCSSSQIQNQDYAKTALPIIAIPFVGACILYAIFGFVLV
jgi:Na+/H+ antiporter NhaC